MTCAAPRGQGPKQWMRIGPFWALREGEGAKADTKQLGPPDVSAPALFTEELCRSSWDLSIVMFAFTVLRRLQVEMPYSCKAMKCHGHVADEVLLMLPHLSASFRRSEAPSGCAPATVDVLSLEEGGRAPEEAYSAARKARAGTAG